MELSVKSFKSYLKEQTSMSTMKEMKSYVKRALKNVKFTDSNRGGYHIRFPLEGSEKDIEKFLKKYNLEVKDYNGNPISSKFETQLLVLTRDVSSKLKAGSSIPWVNNFAGATVAGGQLFGNKDLNPDNLGLGGKTLTSDQIISTVTNKLQKRYDPSISKQLTDMANAANSKGNTIAFTSTFSSKDLAKVSADYGEILSAIWAQKNLGFKKSFFPTASNEKLIDFYGIRFGVNYPISVKSGGGGKVTVQNIIDAINKRAKSANSSDIAKEPALAIFKIVNQMSMREQMIELHKYMKTPAIKKLSEITGINVNAMNLQNIDKYLSKMTKENLLVALEPFWNILNTQLTDRIKQADDKLRLIISPLGESIWKVLNEDKDIQDSLTRIARQVTLIQVNVDVTKTQIKFQSNYFRDADFEFGWAGYAAGNKLGFKMKVKK